MSDAILSMVSGANPAGVWMTSLVDASVKGVIVLLCAGATTLLVRRSSAAVRHLVWCLAVVGLLALPVLSVVLPAWRVPIPAAMRGDPAAEEAVVDGMSDASSTAATRAAAGARATDGPEATSVEHVTSATAATDARATAGTGVPIVDSGAPAGDGGLVGSAGHARVIAAPTSFGRPTTPSGRGAAARSVDAGSDSPLDWAWIALGVWLGGALAVLVSLGVGLSKVRRLAACARPLKTGRAASLTVRLARGLGVRRRVKLLEGHELAMPMTWGLLRPAVLLPAGAEAWPHERLEAVLLHELAHVRRGDHATQILAEIVCALYWFNPLVWLAARRLRIEREHACDDYVLAAGSKASEYASELLELARSLRAQRATAMAAMAMARPSQLTGRLLAVLDEQRSRTAVSGRRAVPALIGAGMLIVPLAAATPVAGPPATNVATSTDAPAGTPADASATGARRNPAPVPAATTPASNVVKSAESAADARVRPGSDAAEMSPTLSGSITEPGTPEDLPSGAGRPRPALPADGWAKIATAAASARQCWNAASESSSVSHNSNDDVETIRWSNGRCRIEMRIEGEIEFTGDFSGIARISPGGLVRIEEDDGATERELEATPGPDGRPVYEWIVDGDSRPFDTVAQAWLREVLLQFFRTTAYAVDERVEWILAERGPEGVFEEVGLMRSDYVQRRYLEALLEQADLDDEAVSRAVELAGRELGSDYELAEVLIGLSERFAFSAPVRQSFIQASQSLGSDYEHRRVLSAALAEGRLSTENVQAILLSAQSIDSDYEVAELLIDVIGEYPFDEPMREAYLAAAGSIESDYERRRVLSALVARGDLSPANLAAVIEAAMDIDSDYELAELLIQLSEHDLSATEIQRAFLQATTSLASDYEHRRVLSRMLDRESLQPELLAVVLVSATRIDSDYELAELLVQIARNYTLAGPLREAYLKAADTIGSEYEHGRVASALLRSRP